MPIWNAQIVKALWEWEDSIFEFAQMKNGFLKFITTEA